MKIIKTILIFTLIILLKVSNAQEESKKIILNTGRHNDFLRFVLICVDETTRNSIKANLLKDKKIHIALPDGATIEHVGKPIIEREQTKLFIINKIGNDLFIEIPNLKEIKIYKFNSPYRFVVDAYFNQTIAEESKVKGDITIIIDPGHGGKDKGLHYRDIYEKDITLLISKEIMTKLSQKGIKSAVTRVYDEDLSLKNRLKIIDSKYAIFLSIHVASEDIFRIYYLKDNKSYSEANDTKLIEKFAQILTKSLERNFSSPIVQENIPVFILKYSNSPSLLIEIPKRSLLNDKKYLNKISDILTNSIITLVSFRTK